MKKLLRLPNRVAFYYACYNIPRASAALSYYMTMTFFPLIICLYTLLGKNYQRVSETLTFFSQFLSAETVTMLRGFLSYVMRSSSTAMLIAGLTVLLTSASAGVRTLQITIGEMQGGQRHTGISNILFSLIYSVAFVASIYFAILVVFTGRSIIEQINGLLPFIDIGGSWQWFRFTLLGGIVFVILWAMYLTARNRGARFRCYPGAIFAMLGILVMTYVFSIFISASTRYPLVYGSLASLILLMFWLFLSCQIIMLGAAVNLAIRDVYTRSEK